MISTLIAIYNFLKPKKWLLGIILVLLITTFAMLASRLKLEEDISGFMPSGNNNEKINFLYKNIGISERFILKFSVGTDSTDRDKLIHSAELFAAQLDSSTSGKNYIKDIFYKIDDELMFEVSSFITANAPYYLTDADYRRIEKMISPDSIRQILENNKKTLISPAGMVLKQNIISDPLHISAPLLGRLSEFRVSNDYTLYNGYIFSKDGKYLMMFITSASPVSETARNQELVTQIDSCVAVVKKNTGTDVQYFGAAAVAVTNARQIKKDSYISITISVFLILIILIVFFRNFRSLLLIAVPVVFGALMALAALFLIKGTISAIAIGAGSIIFGIAINYSLHYLIHSRHSKDQREMLKDLASPLITGSITTVGAFLSLLFISADSMRDFGLFAALSLIGTLIFVLIFLPHFIKASKQTSETRVHGFLDKLSEYRFEKKKWIRIGVFFLSLLLFYFSFGVKFDTEMNKINYMTPQQKEAFTELSGYTTLGKKSVYFVTDASNLDKALTDYETKRPVIDSLIATGDIISVSGIGSFLPSEQMQHQQLSRWNNFWAEHADTVKILLLSEGKKLGFKESSFNNFFGQIDSSYQVQAPQYFSVITDNFVKDYLIVKPDRAMVVTVVYTEKNKLEKITRLLNGQDSFIFDSSSIAQSLVDTLSSDFNKVLYICGLLVILFLTISFGRLELSLIAFFPMMISWIWILGIMSIFGIGFNIVNIILATFIFGLGDDYTIFMMEGLMNEYATRRRLLASYKTAVVLSSITMFVGIGTLVFAKHPAMRSLADVTIIGMLAVVLISFIIPPLFFGTLVNKKGERRMIPVTFRAFFATLYSFLAFLVGCLILSVYGFLLLGIRKPTPKNQLRYHKAMRLITDYVSKRIPGVQRRVINNFGEDFSKPGIIISNHQSHIDLMYILMLSPKIVVLTNDWVWNSPFYGKMVKYARFYPVANGIENSISKLETLVNEGYSIMVFPEGTRSEDCSILRFHRGAFFLAEKLGLDIMPVVMHGLGQALPKKEMLLRKSIITVKILSRITPENTQFGENYSERAKNIRKMYIDEYNAIVAEIETPAFFSYQVIHNYVYKGATVERYARKLLKNFQNFEELIARIPNNTRVAVAACRYGVLPLMISTVRKNVTVMASDTNTDALDIARNCMLNPSNLQYFDEESFGSFYENSDMLVCADPDRHSTELLLKYKKACMVVAQPNNVFLPELSSAGFAKTESRSNKFVILTRV